MPVLFIAFTTIIFVCFGIHWWSILFWLLILSILNSDLSQTQRKWKRAARKARDRWG